MNIKECNLMLTGLKINDNTLKEWQYEFNQMVFQYAYDYAISPITFIIREKSIEIGKKVKDYDCSKSQNKAIEKQKLLKALRKIYDTINSLSYPDDEETYNLQQRIINRELANSIKVKREENINIELIEKQLIKNQKYSNILKNTNITKLSEIQEELIIIYQELVSNKFKIVT